MTTEEILSTYGDTIQKYADQFGVDANLIAATIQTESSGNPNAFRAETKYPPGSYGLMQLLYTTAQGLGYSGAPSGLFDVDTNISLGTQLLGQLIQRFGNDPAAIYSAYNSGSPTAYESNTQVASNVDRFLANLSSVAGAVAASVQSGVQSVAEAAQSAAQAVEDNPADTTGAGIIIAGLILLYIFTKR